MASSGKVWGRVLWAEGTENKVMVGGKLGVAKKQKEPIEDDANQGLGRRTIWGQDMTQG